MDKRNPSRRGTSEAGRPERRAADKVQGLSRALRLLKNFWARPLGFQRQGKGVKVVLVERRRRRMEDEPPTLLQVRAELRDRLLSHKHAHAPQVMRHLALVHDELGRNGWPGVEGLPAQVLGMAAVQAEMLASEGPSAAMSHFIERLRIFKVAADVRGEREARVRTRPPGGTTTLPPAAAAADLAAPKDSSLEGDGRSWSGPVPVPVVIRDHHD